LLATNASGFVPEPEENLGDDLSEALEVLSELGRVGKGNYR
jgi:hypothetical protein